MIDGSPLPAIDTPHEAPFWSALRDGVLCMQHCSTCGHWQFPPLLRCGACGADITWRPVSGRGRLWSLTEIHGPVLPAFAPLTPYLVALVALEESVSLRMVGNLVRAPGGPINAVRLSEVRIDMAVTAVIEKLAEGIYWPRWQVTGS